MQSCASHEYDSGYMEATLIRGNNYDLRSSWLIRECSVCGHQVKALVATDRVNEVDYDSN